MGGFPSHQDNQQRSHQHQYQTQVLISLKTVLWVRGKIGTLALGDKLDTKYKELLHVEN
jgi:hypothetical protein